jgi:hypothetical protein
MKKINYYIPKDCFEHDGDEISDIIDLTAFLKKPKNVDCYVLEVTPKSVYEGLDNLDHDEYYGY